MERITILFLIFYLFLIGCNRNDNYIQGNWYAISSDSVYSEVNFSKGVYRAYYLSVSDIVKSEYKLVNDKMYFYFGSGEKNSQYEPKFIRHSKNSFSLIDSLITQTFYRIPNYEFTIDQVTAYDEWYQYYILSFYLRRFKNTNGHYSLPAIESDYGNYLIQGD